MRVTFNINGGKDSILVAESEVSIKERKSKERDFILKKVS